MMITIKLRVLDVSFAFLGLLILWPIIAVCLLVGIFGDGAPLFRQERLGRSMVPFVLLKFRTMARNSPSLPSHLVSAQAITPLGRVMRRNKLDELPQLWNVLLGEMSIVGPRPGLPNQPQLTEARKKLGIFEVRPGITGLAQINGVDMSTPELLAQTDARMIAEMSVRNYFKYIFLTVLGKGSGDRVKS